MADKPRRVKQRKKTGVRIDFRASEEWVEKLDAWCAAQNIRPTRSQALRHLVDKALEAETEKK